MKPVEAMRKAGQVVKGPALHAGEAALVVLTLALWIATFALGILVDSEPYRDVVRAWSLPLSGQELEAGAMVLLTYTVPNLLLLCVFASLLGALGSHARLGPDDEKSWRDLSSPYLSAAIRGFFVYLAFVAGVLILNEDVFLSPSPGGYIRTGAVMSLASFMASYNPGTFGALLARVASRLQSADPNERTGAGRNPATEGQGGDRPALEPPRLPGPRAVDERPGAPPPSATPR